MTIAKRLDALQQKHPALGFPIAVLYKFLDDQGVYLAALIAYYGFISLFSSSSVALDHSRLRAVGRPQARQQILDSALHQFPVIGDDLGNAQQIDGGVTGLVIGIVGGLYGGASVSLWLARTR